MNKFDVWVICDGLKCVFLNPDTKKCAVYEYRPQVCRDYGIGKFDALSCPYLKSNGKRRTPAMVKRVQRQINKNVDKNGIYPTTKFFNRIDNFWMERFNLTEEELKNEKT